MLDSFSQSHDRVVFFYIYAFGKAVTKLYLNVMVFIFKNFTYLFFIIRKSNQVKSIIVTEVTVMGPFIRYSSQNPKNFLDMEVIMIKEDDKR